MFLAENYSGCDFDTVWDYTKSGIPHKKEFEKNYNKVIREIKMEAIES